MRAEERLRRAVQAYLRRQPGCIAMPYLGGRQRAEIPLGPCGGRQMAMWCQGADDLPTLCDGCAEFFRLRYPEEVCVSRRPDDREVREMIDAASAESWSLVKEQRS